MARLPPEDYSLSDGKCDANLGIQCIDVDFPFISAAVPLKSLICGCGADCTRHLFHLGTSAPPQPCSYIDSARPHIDTVRLNSTSCARACVSNPEPVLKGGRRGQRILYYPKSLWTWQKPGTQRDDASLNATTRSLRHVEML